MDGVKGCCRLGRFGKDADFLPSSGGVRNLARHGPGSRERTTHIVVNKVEALSETELESASTLCATVGNPVSTLAGP